MALAFCSAKTLKDHKWRGSGAAIPGCMGVPMCLKPWAGLAWPRGVSRSRASSRVACLGQLSGIMGMNVEVSGNSVSS